MNRLTTRLTALPKQAPGLPAFISQNRTFQAACAQGNALVQQLRPMALWGLPVALGGIWFIWPALTDSFRTSLGRPKAKEPIISKVGYKQDEIDTMPVKRG